MLSKLKCPSWKRTHLLFKRLRNHDGAGPIAALCGKESQTVDSWCRPVATDENPGGTGQNNPVDCVNRIIGYAYTKEPGLAREIAEATVDYVDFLEGKPANREMSPNALIASSVKEHSEAIVAVLNVNEPDFVKAHTEIVQAEIAIRRLKTWVKDEMKAETETRLRVVGGG